MSIPTEGKEEWWYRHNKPYHNYCDNDVGDRLTHEPRYDPDFGTSLNGTWSLRDVATKKVVFYLDLERNYKEQRESPDEKCNWSELCAHMGLICQAPQLLELMESMLAHFEDGVMPNKALMNRMYTLIQFARGGWYYETPLKQHGDCYHIELDHENGNPVEDMMEGFDANTGS